MNSRRKITLILVAVVSLAGIAFWLLRPREPVYEGRPLSAWLEQLTATRDGVEHEQAVAAVRAIGTNAVPHLLMLARYEDSRWRITLNRWQRDLLPDSVSISHAQLQEQELWHQAMAGFLALRSEAKDAVPALTELLMSSDRPLMVAHYLHAIGTNGIPALTGALTFSNRESRVSAVKGLAMFGPQAESAVPNIVAAIDTNDPSSQTYFLRALGQIRRQPEVAVPALVRSLESSSMEVRVWAAKSLAQFGSSAEPARAELEIAATDPNTYVRSAANEALTKMGPARK